MTRVQKFLGFPPTGAESSQAIGPWAADTAEWLQQYLALPTGIPSHDTIGRLLVLLKPAAFQSCFQQLIHDCERATLLALNGKQEIVVVL